ncbi:hypothetical protein ACTXJG_10445, partial [Glutamicibacter arilaitensis]|uniref:hypothetical protein n=2 Tax=Glutamicibacter arilaitensis TaxID=256701 RepID=UPI003FD32D4D
AVSDVLMPRVYDVLSLVVSDVVSSCVNKLPSDYIDQAGTGHRCFSLPEYFRAKQNPPFAQTLIGLREGRVLPIGLWPGKH